MSFLARRTLDGGQVAVLAVLPLAGLLVGPAYASLAWVFAGLGVAAILLGRPGVPDAALMWLAACFCVLCGASALWSIAPHRSLAATLQLAAILAASLALLAGPTIGPAAASRAFGAMTLALCAGVLIMCADAALHFPLQRQLAPRELYPGTKYNRGEDYLTLLLWPMLAFWLLQGRYARALLTAVAVLVAVAIGQSTTARVTLPVGLLTLLTAWWTPKLVMRVLTWGSVMVAGLLPVLLHTLAADRLLVWRHLKQSGLHRLEIWDYMTARVAERPLFGWGFATAKLVPIRAAEMRGYVWVDPHGVYPHNQVLQLWLETGLVGAVFGVGFVLLVLRRIARLPPRIYPFACAAFAAAFAVSASSFELTTDSWWAALTLTAMLLRLAETAAMQ
jgi:O-antigen ligase